MADSDAQETRQPSPKESPFSIKNLLNIEDKPAKPRSALGSPRGVLEGGFFSRLGDLSFPRFDLSTQRLGLSAQYLERATTWWYPYTLSAHLRAGGKSFCTLFMTRHLVKDKKNIYYCQHALQVLHVGNCYIFVLCFFSFTRGSGCPIK